jgi:hypothetical protein
MINHTEYHVCNVLYTEQFLDLHEASPDDSDDDSSSNGGKAFEMEGGSDAIYLNDEFAVPLSAAKTWAAEFKGDSICESVCLSVDDEDPTTGCNHLTACICGACLKVLETK